MKYEEKTVRKNLVYKGKIITLYCDDALGSDGKACTREYVAHGGGACVLYEEDGKVAFVRQYRYPYGEETLEIPAGKIDQGEPPENTALRELEEEAGVKAGRLELMHVMYPSPGYTNEKIYVYRAYDGERVNAHLDEDEFLDVEWYDREEIERLLSAGKINDAKTLIALLQYLQKK